jgi:hypothetical protein
LNLGLGVNLLTLMYLGRVRHFGSLIVFLFITVLVYAQEPGSYKYHFNSGTEGSNILNDRHSIIIDYFLPELDLNSIENDFGSFYRLNVPGHNLTTDPGKPELPVFSRLIAVPGGSECRVRITNVKFLRIRPSVNKIKGKLYPAQYGDIKSQERQNRDFVIDRELYARESIINPDTVSIKPLGIIRGNQLSTLLINPVRYNPVSNFLEVITSMKIEILFSKELSISPKSDLSGSALFDESLDKGVLNYNPEDFITGYSDEPVGMIILTDTAFRKYLEPFYKWKRQKGYKLDILYRGAGLAGDSYSELKESISNIYASGAASGHAPEYLLIIGSSQRIPYYGSGNITDLYYGEFDGGGDYLPDMYIGRIPANDTSSVKSVVSKIVQYEKFEFADTNSFYNRALVFAGLDATYANHMNGQVKYAITNYLTPGNNINEYHFYYPEGSTKKDSIMKLIAGGLSFINYTGHGSAAGWLHVDIKSPDIKNFNNRNRYPFVISNACRTAQFTDTASFGNKILLSSGKGAIGYIGCTNDSYWDEDFAWAVGAGIPGADPKYSQTGLGAYDRLFHTHGELPSEWYISAGQINFAGNLSVSATTTYRKKYYWETYEVLGDPSLIPYIGTPQPLNISLPDILPNGLRSLSITTDPFTYVAISRSGVLLDASYTSPSGTAVLELPDLSNDSCLVVITGQNKIPYIKTINFTELSGEFLNLTESGINDTEANNNGKADFGETLFLKLKISNLGLSAATDLTATISSSSPWVTINNNSVSIGTLNGKSEIVLDDDLQLTIDDDVPDLGIITLDLNLKDSRTEKNYRIDITLHAPELEIISCLIDDSLYGNGDFVADPGENFNLVFQVKNLGSSNTSGQFIIESQVNHLEILDQNVKSGVLQFGETANIPVAAKLSESARFGNYITLISTLDCSPYIVNKDFTFRVGKIRENFESSTFTIFPWINLSEKPWTITNSTYAEGNLAARSGMIGHNSSSTLIIRTYFPEDDTLKFYYKVSSENNYDYFQFNLNDTEIMRKSGEVDWEIKKIAVGSGHNKMEWIYKKDNTVSQGADAAWIDLIDFAHSAPVEYITRDLEISSIISPMQKEIYGMEPVTVVLTNPGRDLLDGFNLAYTINDKPPVVQYFDITLNPYKDTVTVTFDRRADMDLSGIYNISVFGYENSDDFLGNDTLKISLENTEIEETVTIYPNPFTDQLNITMNSKFYRKVHFRLINISGKIVYSSEKDLVEGENQITIDTYKLSPAVYFLDIEGTSFTRAFPLIKLKR